jgi:UrcA family protein
MSSTTSNISKFFHGTAFRPALVWIVCLLGTVALASIVSLLGITPAWSGTPTTQSVTVSFRDLDLSRPEGATALYHRIQAAARQVCGYRGTDLIERAIWTGCYSAAVADAVGKVNNPLLTAVHTGRPVAMTAMLAK